MSQHLQKLNAIVSQLLDWFDKNARDLPWRRTRDPYAIWISEIMLQQTQVKTVIPYWNRWMRRLPDLQSLARANPQAVLKLWEGLGYYSRARNAQKAAQIIVKDFGGVFPRDFEQVLELPGIGRYTAGAICSIAFNQPTAILDGNVARVLSRVFGVKGSVRETETKERLWQLAQELANAAAQIPEMRGLSDCALQIAENFKFEISDFQKRTGAAGQFQGNCSKLNQALMELGALVCLPRNAACPSCPVQNGCFAWRNQQVEKFPSPAKATRITQRRFIAFVVSNKGRYLVQQRGPDGVNAGFWEFPNVEITPGTEAFEEHAKPFVISDPQPICRVRHSITRYRILLEAFRAELPTTGKQGSWHTLAELRKLPFASAHKKILQRLG